MKATYRKIFDLKTRRWRWPKSLSNLAKYYYTKGKSLNEVAKKLGVPRDTVKLWVGENARPRAEASLVSRKRWWAKWRKDRAVGKIVSKMGPKYKQAQPKDLMK